MKFVTRVAICALWCIDALDKIEYNLIRRMDDWTDRVNNYDKYSELEWYHRPIESWEDFKRG